MLKRMIYDTVDDRRSNEKLLGNRQKLHFWECNNYKINVVYFITLLKLCKLFIVND